VKNSGIDFVTYYKAGEAWLVKVGGPTINSAATCAATAWPWNRHHRGERRLGLHGQSVGGTSISGDKDNCPSGKDIKVLSFGTQTDANSALLSGRADFGWLDPARRRLPGEAAWPASWHRRQAMQRRAIWHCDGQGSPLEKPITDAVKYLIDNNGYYATSSRAGT